jgi:hypothetical protein
VQRRHHIETDIAASDKVYQWFSPASSTTKTGRHDIVEILLKVAMKTRTVVSNLSAISVSM